MYQHLTDLDNRAHIEGADTIPGNRCRTTAWRRTRDGRSLTLRVERGVCTVELERQPPFTGTESDALRFISRNAR